MFFAERFGGPKAKFAATDDPKVIQG
jgi:hypothetical protein